MDDYEMEECELVDRLSELPQALIHSILSFLPMRDVVSTSLLSKKWKNLWATVPCLNIWVDMIHVDQHFVNRLLMLWKGTKILKFEIVIDFHFYISSASVMDLWVRFAVENKVEDLHIDLSYDVHETPWFGSDWEIVVENSKKDVYCVPQCLYSCSSIRKLRLVGCNLGNYGSPSWNQLKSLIIYGFCFGESSINLIMSGSPRLEVFELWLMDSNEDLNIVSTSLKKLTIEKYLHTDSDKDGPSSSTVLRICCPNLETLEILGSLYSKCLFADVSSLTDVTIGFDDSHFLVSWLGEGQEDRLLEDVLRQILSTIQHVEKVTLSYWCGQVLGGSQKKHLLSPLQNVEFLKLHSCRFELGDMMDFLGIFPNLKMLVIGHLRIPNLPENCMEFEANLSKSFLLQLKIVEITSFFFDSSKLWFFELLLKRASMLEKLVIRVKDIDSHQQEHLSEVAQKLQSMPRSSPTAKVIFNST
ncbi:hypothetical protein ACS0TY_016475 [Phlomoides rotata]